ncbi:hypothetical protein DPMN_117772 [Dreissena polymorpha]|uniref:Uncharacterized protein n=1 Tax=Dreissena polymorpha TaxID=45954 RepID=A0A9D4JMX4_DREPO|nr:hypothetical protein DPMN_117772 [Dreissena polymorpha]
MHQVGGKDTIPMGQIHGEWSNHNIFLKVRVQIRLYGPSDNMTADLVVGLSGE